MDICYMYICKNMIDESKSKIRLNKENVTKINISFFFNIHWCI